MKAEHRKELQTNALADMLGRTVRNVRGGGGGISWFKVSVVLVIILGGLLAYWIIASKARTRADNWSKVEHGDLTALNELRRDAAGTNPGQVAEYTFGYSVLWEVIKTLGDRDPKETRDYLFGISKHFEKLAEEYKDDPDRCAEAKYHMAVATETMAAIEPPPAQKKQFDEAKRILAEMTQGELATTAYGKIAQKRLDQYNDPVQFHGIEKFYNEFNIATKFTKAGG